MRAIADSKSAATSPEQRDIAITEVARLEPQIAKIEEDIRVTTDEHIRKLVADAAAGIERARVKMLEIYDENEKVFREGVAGKAAPVAGGFRFGLEQANAAAIQQKAKDEQDLDNQKRVVKLTEAIEKKEAAEFDRAADETVRTRAEAKRVADEAADFDRSAKATFRQQMAAKAGLDKPGIASRIKAEDASIAGGAYVPRAAGEMARMQAQGGDMDRFGRFHKMTDAQIQDLVQKRVQAELQRNNPGMGAEQRGDVATKITSLATTDLQKRMTAMNAGGLNNTARLIAITAQLTSEVQKQVLVGQAQARAIDQVSRQAAGIGQTRQNFRNR
jgi:hypothetical protein